MKCMICNAEGARWTQFQHGHCAACVPCREKHNGWTRGEAPVSCALPEDGDDGLPKHPLCYRLTSEGLCKLPKGHAEDCRFEPVQMTGTFLHAR